jgi:hypothetical protein
MSDFFQQLTTRIISNKAYHSTKQSLFSAYVYDLIGEKKPIYRDSIKRMVESAQIFYKSEIKQFQDEGAILLAILLDLYAKEYPELIPIAHNLFANSGDFPNIELLSQRHPDVEFRYSFDSHAENDFRKDLNTVDEMNFTLTNFQRTLWEDLTLGNDVITSAPTSAGKTHIILNYLLDKVVKSNGEFAAIIVPTRALITEVAAKLYDLLKERDLSNDIEICTVPRKGVFKAKTFFVMTQERLHEILLIGDVRFDYLFIDEAQNITDNSRGVLLHITIEKVLEDSLPQIIISMPSSSYQNSFSSIFKDIQFKKKITKHSPVAKIIMNVTPKGKNLNISLLHSDCGLTLPKGFTGTRFADIIFKLGQGQSNIIYRNRTDYCENIADELSTKVKTATPDYVPNALQEEAADYVEKFIHEKYTLADNLRNGVAFHYGPLPGSIRVMVENLVKEGHINFIACTSTLAEGVNLPAKNLFLNNPMQTREMQSSVRIEDVKINNITGRAGRMLKHFSGNIFLVNPEEWDVKDYFDENDEQEEKKIPTYFKSINEELGNVISALDGNYAHTEDDQYKFYTIANKLLREFGSENLANTFDAEDLTISAANRVWLLDTLSAAYANLRVATFTLESNPTVGYIQQNKLYLFLVSEPDLMPWALPHPKSPKLYDAMLNICSKLIEYGVYTPNEKYSNEHICVITKKWIQGESLKEIIREQISWNNRNNVEDSINTAIRKVISAINTDIRFRLSNALRCYQLLLNNVLAERGLELSKVKIHSYIEVGACDDRVISLINLGLSREAAIEIDGLLAQAIEITSHSDLIGLMDSDALSEIHNITRKELSGLLKH